MMMISPIKKMNSTSDDTTSYHSYSYSLFMRREIQPQFFLFLRPVVIVLKISAKVNRCQLI